MNSNIHKDKVLIVEDDESMRGMLELILREEYEVVTARSGEEALKKLLHSDVHVVLLDIKLPGISGIETLERIIKNDPDIKCLMLSAVHDVGTVVECMRKGAHDYMTKELEYESVLVRVRNAITLFGLKKAYDRQIQRVMRLEALLDKPYHKQAEQFSIQEKDFNPESEVFLIFPKVML